MARSKSRVSGVVLRGPLEPFGDAYRAELRSRGYTPRTAVNELRQVARLSRWLDSSGLAAGELNSDRVEEFLAVQRAGGRNRSQWSRPGLLCMLDLLRTQGVVDGCAALAAPSATEQLLGSFERYLCSERGLTAGTVRGYSAHARRFVDGLPGSRLAGVTASEVTTAVLSMAGGGYSVSAAQNFVAGLRAFLRFCFLDGRLDTDLSGAALAVTGRRRSPLPHGISPAQARALLACCDRRTAVGRRDYAIILSLLRLGVRRGELAAVTLDDLDWRAGEVVIHGKGGRADRLPLPNDVGAAIAGYLHRGRPASRRRELFLHARAPFEPIAAATVSSTVRRACARAGLPPMGAHRLRHTMACQMVAAGVPLIQIGQVLRHHSLQSTAGYARVHVEQLRQLAAPWPTGVPR
ncbi:MAG TPA: site-specific integrase [Jatrophihabitantaceae bacterium]|nr:site-specific integrase [Jatrophihabitantaceae bacterium]